MGNETLTEIVNRETVTDEAEPETDEGEQDGEGEGEGEPETEPEDTLPPEAAFDFEAARRKI